MKIPSKVRVTKKTAYRVVYIDEFEDKAQVGECHEEHKQIVLKRSLKGPALIKTFIHELLHAIAHEENIALSHRSIYQLEEVLLSIAQLNGWKLKLQ